MSYRGGTNLPAWFLHINRFEEEFAESCLRPRSCEFKNSCVARGAVEGFQSPPDRP